MGLDLARVVNAWHRLFRKRRHKHSPRKNRRLACTLLEDAAERAQWQEAAERAAARARTQAVPIFPGPPRPRPYAPAANQDWWSR